MLDFRLNTFLTVCKYMNFTRAAEELNITQPAVSQHIRYLEELFEVKLFDYHNKKISLTEAGTFLQSTATTMVHDVMHLQDKLRQLQGEKRELVFGVTLTVGEFVIPAPVASYLKAHPEAAVHVTVANTQELLKKLNDGQIDFALVEGFFAKSEYDSKVYSNEPYIGVCGPSYQPAKKMMRIEDTFDERIIVREEGSGTREIFERYLESRNFLISDYKSILEISNINAIKALAAAGCGITFLYEAAVKKELETGELIKIPLLDFDLTHDFTFIWRRNSVFSPDYIELFQQLKDAREG
ncbi:LysR family transcriptional regulator [Ihubacter massiliensis]|uniref:LysR family transcriptional regulator n=1 Tax=Hominibacterium faecale TaxID=2839743 RepID=A0A9J6QX20_9FIRM|nr:MULTISPECIES: LysR family transcriptional regulator [Eubacteriales Family XIII. Incertae Sedis]MCC2865076.1 LysR family transcriptional regulator [Anaerovorax odorimutans]MCI7303989.1 LysR family transcriptional regulator [Clostridia bacterium]MDY3012183.1 LysR family transcriptional regulator [Clostridiales Family XIII bacterium]MCO7120737.1 LysR family transcriptional regulator [Ihubacter massiliensis]MCU7380038.1 LysR family transcriptional regulator [Hominibacterium faecale]